jgi:hypothetical protein
MSVFFLCVVFGSVIVVGVVGALSVVLVGTAALVYSRLRRHQRSKTKPAAALTDPSRPAPARQTWGLDSHEAMDAAARQADRIGVVTTGARRARSEAAAAAATPQAIVDLDAPVLGSGAASGSSNDGGPSEHLSRTGARGGSAHGSARGGKSHGGAKAKQGKKVKGAGAGSAKPKKAKGRTATAPAARGPISSSSTGSTGPGGSEASPPARVLAITDGDVHVASVVLPGGPGGASARVAMSDAQAAQRMPRTKNMTKRT